MRSGFSLKNPALTRVELTHDFLTTVLILIFILIVGILCEVTTFNINRPLGRRRYSSVYSSGGSQTVSFTLLLCLALSKGVPKQFNLLFYDLRWQQVCVCVCLSVCCHRNPIYSGRQTCGRTSRGHTGGRSHRIPFLHVPSAVLALIFIARRIHPSLSLVEVLLDYFKGKFEHEERRHPNIQTSTQ